MSIQFPYSELQLDEDIFRLMVESAEEGMCVVDSVGRVLFCNRKTQELLGRTFDEIKGRVVSSFMDPETAKIFDEARERRKTGNRESMS